MKLHQNNIDRLYNKAKKSLCVYKISAMGIDHSGNMIGVSFNVKRFTKSGGGIHAEMNLMAQYGSNLKTIIICRSNNAGTEMLPIHPCERCSKKASELGIKIIPLLDIIGVK